MQRIKHTFCALVMLAGIGSAWTQQSLKTTLDTYRTKQDTESLKVLSGHPNPKEVAAAIYASAIDTTITDHKGTVYLIKQLERKTTDPVVRESYVRSLTEILFRPSSTVAASALKVMQQFDRANFSQSAKEDLMTYISEQKDNRGEAILLLGFVGNPNDVSFLKNLEHYTSISKKDKYKVKLALVRLNDRTAVEEFMTELSARTVNDNLVTDLLPDLIYTHHPAVYTYLLNELYNELPACLSANNDSEDRVLCSYRIMEQIAEEIIDFPVKLDPSGELSGDYEEALNTARKWYQANRKSFTINPDNY